MYITLRKTDALLTSVSLTDIESTETGCCGHQLWPCTLTPRNETECGCGSVKGGFSYIEAFRGPNAICLVFLKHRETPGPLCTG